MQITLQTINVPTKTLDKMIEFYVCICEKKFSFFEKNNEWSVKILLNDS